METLFGFCSLSRFKRSPETAQLLLQTMLQLPLLDIPLRLRRQPQQTQVWDRIRKNWVALTPEEHVRQSLIHWLIDHCQYPAALIAVERGISFGHTTLRYDALVFQRDTTQPWMLLECKAPEVQLDDQVLQQTLRYFSKLPGCRYGLISNGHQSFCADCRAPEGLRWLDSLPAYEF